jgi:predicted nucleic acid-binding protein
MVDTTFVVDYLRDVDAAVKRYERLFELGDNVLVNEIVLCEAATGAPEHPDPALQKFMSPVEFLQPGPDSALLAGEWRAAARSQGRQLSLADALIAAAAHSVNATVLTRNVRDFALTPVRVETY